MRIDMSSTNRFVSVLPRVAVGSALSFHRRMPEHQRQSQISIVRCESVNSADERLQGTAEGVTLCAIAFRDSSSPSLRFQIPMASGAVSFQNDLQGSSQPLYRRRASINRTVDSGSGCDCVEFAWPYRRVRSDAQHRRGGRRSRRRESPVDDDRRINSLKTPVSPRSAAQADDDCDGALRPDKSYIAIPNGAPSPRARRYPTPVTSIDRHPQCPAQCHHYRCLSIASSTRERDRIR